MLSPPSHPSRLRDPLVRLRLRRPLCRLGQRAQDAPPCELDLEIVVAEAVRLAEDHLGGALEILARRRDALELRLRVTVAPRLVGDAAEREARLADGAAIHIEADGDRDQGEG